MKFLRAIFNLKENQVIIENINEYCNKLGSVSPAPGGGSAAGLVLSLAASSVEKAMRFSFEGENDFILEANKIKDAGLKLSDDDQISFLDWGKARKLPKETDDQKKIRTEQVNFYALECTRVPYETGKYSIQLLKLILDFVPQCSKWLISDAGVGASFAYASYESAVFNIKINLSFVKDESFKNELIKFIDESKSAALELKNKIFELCSSNN
jgi:formiminotetrahydrofolate cyclodeaminase